ncbi:intraflagellar transport protein 52 homolog [Uloborus diversus]|uniref:intraflagellar transport protein 52 homolog n=1 Tax=Uloborus diversus TaxID=327109 RepID=UPI0024094236|nr:intraflagellar transport protein 52 homolog [Uloborus diversus]
MSLSKAKSIKECNIVTFNASKNEILKVEQMKVFLRKLVSKGFTVAVNNGRISAKVLAKSKIYVLLCSRSNFDGIELNLFRTFIKQGGRLLVTSTEGKTTSNINVLLKEYGVEFRSDTVIGIVRNSNYFYPKEVLIADGIVNESIHAVNLQFKYCEKSPLFENKRPFPILYPFGCTINVDKPAVVLVSTGSFSYPLDRPTCGFYQNSSNGRILAFGSSCFFADIYIRKELNSKMVDSFLQLLSDEKIELSIADIQCPDIADYAQMPCTEKMSDMPYSCLTEGEEIPSEIDSLFNRKLYQVDMRYLPGVLSAYKTLNMPKEPLKIIKPKFEVPLPLLQPAYVPPRSRSAPNPYLELMDLDEFFTNPWTRLAQLTNKCSNMDLEYYIIEAAEILNIMMDCEGKKNTKRVLEFVLCKIIELKKYRY